MPFDRAQALRQLCNTPQHKNKVEEEKLYFLLYLNYAVNNLQRLVSNDRFDTGIKDEKGKQQTAEVLPENLFEVDDKEINGKIIIYYSVETPRIGGSNSAYATH